MHSASFEIKLLFLTLSSRSHAFDELDAEVIFPPIKSHPEDLGTFRSPAEEKLGDYRVMAKSFASSKSNSGQSIHH